LDFFFFFFKELERLKIKGLVMGDPRQIGDEDPEHNSRRFIRNKKKSGGDIGSSEM
jgi:hypothetical protein